ncbi:MAG: DUF2069 domain-containing protein [Pseudomonadota bacterium]
MNNERMWRVAALTGYFGTLILVLVWVAFLSNPKVPKSAVLAIALLPMLPAVRGLLHGRIYTFQWASFLALPYFAFAVDALIHQRSSPWLATLMLILSLLWFFGCTMTARKYKKLSQKQNNASEKAP